MDEDPFEDWERYPVDEAQERLEYQKLAWYSAPFGSTGIAVVLLAAGVNLARRLGRQVIRIASRLKLV
jgi:hypothetical protein